MADHSNTDPGMLEFVSGFYAAEQDGFEAVGFENARAMLDAFPEMVDATAVEVGQVRERAIADAAGPLQARLYLP